MTDLASCLASFDEFLYFPSIDWDHPWERQQTLISAFAEAHEPRRGIVVAPSGLVDHAPWRLQTWRRVLSKDRHGTAAMTAPRLQAHRRPANLDYIRPGFARGTNAVFAQAALASSRELRAALRRRGRRLVVACYVNPLVERFLATADVAVLDLAERRQSNPHLSPDARTREAAWAARVDLLVADNSATLADYADARRRAGRSEGHLIPQGFTPPEAAEAAKRGGRIAAYLGNLHHAVDYAYLGALIDLNPDWTFRLCGHRLCVDADAILARPNVRYAGVISSREIAGFLGGASWGLIPYVRTEWTAGVFPTKLFEYLGHGLPVLSTGIPEVARFADPRFVHIADAAEPLSHLDVDAEELRRFVAPHTWSARFEAYARALSSITR